MENSSLTSYSQPPDIGQYNRFSLSWGRILSFLKLRQQPVELAADDLLAKGPVAVHQQIRQEHLIDPDLLGGDDRYLSMHPIPDDPPGDAVGFIQEIRRLFPAAGGSGIVFTIQVGRHVLDIHRQLERPRFAVDIHHETDPHETTALIGFQHYSICTESDQHLLDLADGPIGRYRGGIIFKFRVGQVPFPLVAADPVDTPESF